ncbi:MAG: hypothetical protein DSY47_03020 [Hydrogenothermus sp.]|nr:MAG: hypothetical protein DSY47_03020 [Hydrogenothermus sp.]
MAGRNFILFIFIFLYIFNFSYSKDFEYKFGRGFKINDVVIGGYSAFIYEHSLDNNYKKFNFEEFAILGFWNLNEKLKFFSELEFKDIFVRASNKEENRDFTLRKIEINRLYLNYIHNDYLKFRIGRFITPLGYWNPIYVIVLRWTTSNPVTSIEFYPRFITGIRTFGFLPIQDDSWSYDIVIQAGKQINGDNNSVITKDFYAFQLKKFFWENSAFGITGGFLKKKENNEKVRFVGFNMNVKKKKYELTLEYFYSRDKLGNLPEYSKYSYYLQGVWRFMPKNYLIGRIELFKDFSDGKNQKNYVIGYNFRPIYPVSIKVEYIRTYNELKEGRFNEWSNRILTSLSVLF